MRGGRLSRPELQDVVGGAQQGEELDVFWRPCRRGRLQRSQDRLARLTFVALAHRLDDRGMEEPVAELGPLGVHHGADFVCIQRRKRLFCKVVQLGPRLQ